jgi:hypothetical protein
MQAEGSGWARALAPARSVIVRIPVVGINTTTLPARLIRCGKSALLHQRITASGAGWADAPSSGGHLPFLARRRRRGPA